MRNFNIYIGAVGWERLGGHAGFYPEDLPGDWRLAFYNTQFRCVYLPYLVWSIAPDDLVATWLNETQDDFCFLLGVSETQLDGQSYKAARFGARGRMESDVEIVWLSPLTNLRDLAGKIKHSSETGQDIYLIASEEEFAQLRQVKELIEVMGV